MGAEVRVRAKTPRRVNVETLAFVLALVLAIQVLLQGVVDSRYLPPPSEVLGALVGDGVVRLGSALLQTLGRFGIALSIAMVAGVALGVLLGASARLYRALRLLIEAFRPLPSVALIPFAVLFLGLTDRMVIAVATYAAFWPIVIGTLYGIRGVDPVSIDTARIFGLSRRQVLWRVMLPGAASSVVASIRVSTAIALVVVVSAELITGAGGIGFFMMAMQNALQIPEMYAAILTVGLLGYLVNVLARGIEDRVVFWKASFAGQRK